MAKVTIEILDTILSFSIVTYMFIFIQISIRITSGLIC